MIESILNACFYVSTLGLYYYKTKRADLYFTVLSAYTAVALLGTYNYFIGVFNDDYHLSIFRLLYLFVVVMICISPLQKVDFKSKDISIIDNRYITVLLLFFIVCGVITISFTLPKAIMLQSIGEWGELRSDVYSGDSTITLYDSQLERFFHNCFSYLLPFGCIMAFYQLTKLKINLWLTSILFTLISLNAYASATLVASRGMIMMFAVKMLILYMIFRKQIPNYRKKYIAIVVSFVALFLISYTMAVTESRFSDESNESLYYYLGHSMFAFDDGIMRTMHDYAGGRYQFGWLFRILGVGSEFNWLNLGCTHGTAFMTFVGNLYVDFGPFFTPVVAIFMSMLLSKYTSKCRYQLSDLIIIAFAATWYAEGVFVFSGDQSLQWLMVFVVSFIVKVFECKRSN